LFVLLVLVVGLIGATLPWLSYAGWVSIPGVRVDDTQHVAVSVTDLASVSAAGATMLLAGFTAVLALYTSRSLQQARQEARIAEDSLEVVKGQGAIFQQQVEAAQAQVAATRDALKASEEQYRQQSMLSLFPQLIPEVLMGDNGEVRLRIVNAGDALAMDVDVWIIGVYSAERLSIEKFMAKYANQDAPEKLGKWRPNDEDLYGVYERHAYYLFPARRRIEVPMPFPDDVSGLYVHIQLRDVVGRNYYHAYWFFFEKGRYRLGAVDPREVVQWPRVEPLSRYGAMQKLFKEGGVHTSDSRATLLWIGRTARSSGILFGSRVVEDAGEWADV
jgi:hypothetical protein